MEARNGKRFGNRYSHKRSLLAEPLEQRDLLAADMFGPPVTAGPPDGAGQPGAVDCAPASTQDAPQQQQQRSAAGDRGPAAGGRGATPAAMARARAAAQLRDRARVTTPGDCQVGDGNEPIQQRDRLHQDQTEDGPVRRQGRSAQADRHLGDRVNSRDRDRDRLADCDTPGTPLAERIGNGQGGQNGNDQGGRNGNTQAGRNGNDQAGRNGSDNRGNGPVDGQIGQRPGVPVVTGELSEEQISGLEQMREEEKLARDVYLALDEKWDVTIFAQIARAESRHMDAVGGMLERYGLEDPIEGHDVGSFPTQQVQDLYDGLVARGLTSLAEAYQVGATIEDLDINDLRKLQEADDLPSDVARVYENLERGSRNHLRAFVGQIEAADGDYVAQEYLTQGEVTEIVSSPIEMGRADRGGRMDRPGRNADALQGRNGDAVRDRDADTERDRNTDALRDRVMDPASACDQVFAEMGRLGTGRGPM
jgi:hypothetical protein